MAPFEEKIRRASWWGEQVAHFMAFALLCSLVTGFLSPWLGVPVCVLAPWVYETAQNWGDATNDTRDMLADFLAHDLGGLTGVAVGVVVGSML